MVEVGKSDHGDWWRWRMALRGGEDREWRFEGLRGYEDTEVVVAVSKAKGVGEGFVIFSHFFLYIFRMLFVGIYMLT